jgi:hypothetical protein
MLQDGALLIETETRGILPAALFKQTIVAMATVAPANEELGAMQGVQVKLDGQTGLPSAVEALPLKHNVGCVAVFPSKIVLGWQKGLFRVNGFAEGWDRAKVAITKVEYDGGAVVGLDVSVNGSGRVVSLMYDRELTKLHPTLASSLRDELAREIASSA